MGASIYQKVPDPNEAAGRLFKIHRLTAVSRSSMPSESSSVGYKKPTKGFIGLLAKAGQRNTGSNNLCSHLFGITRISGHLHPNFFNCSERISQKVDPQHQHLQGSQRYIRLYSCTMVDPADLFSIGRSFVVLEVTSC